LLSVSAKATKSCWLVARIYQAERSALSFAALAEADEASQAKLKKLNAQAATLNLELENVASALAEASKRLVAAQREEALEVKSRTGPRTAHRRQDLRRSRHRTGRHLD
jgi:hypothetical protein